MAGMPYLVLGAVLAFLWTLRLDLGRRRLTLLTTVPSVIFLDLIAAALAAASAALLSGWFLLNARSAPLFPVAPMMWCLAGFGILAFLWHEGRRTIQLQRPPGLVTAEGAILCGALLVVGGISGRLPPWVAPQMAVPWGLLAAAAGGIGTAVLVRGFLREREEHRIIRHVNRAGESLQPEYTPASPECPHPERWTMYDTMTAELEVLQFLKCLVITLKPNLVVETGSFMGISTVWIAEGLRQNGFGKVITCEYDPVVFAKAKRRLDASGLGSWIEYRNESSLDMTVDGTIDLFFSDSDPSIRAQEVRRFLPQINPHGLILMHDAGSHYKVVREAALEMENERWISLVLLPTPRGLAIAQKREGRK